jgi:hypothetical protein
MSSPADFRFSTHDGWMQSTLMELLYELEEYLEPKADIDTVDGDYGVPRVVQNEEHRLLCLIRDACEAIKAGDQATPHDGFILELQRRGYR